MLSASEFAPDAAITTRHARWGREWARGQAWRASPTCNGQDAPCHPERTCQKHENIAAALVAAEERGCPPTADGYVSHTDALTLVKAWLDQFDGSYAHGWKVPEGIGTVEDAVDRALRGPKKP